MDETALRVYFERARSAEPPTSRVDVARARQAGRRRLTARRAAAPAMVLGAIAAVGALFATGILPAGATGHRAPETSTHHHHRSGFAAPASFDPAAIWATFGWLPQGVSVVTPPDGMRSSMSEMEASGPNAQITLTAFAAGQCQLTGPFWYSQTGHHRIKPPPGAGPLHIYNTVRKHYSAGLRCNWGGTPWIPNPVVPSGHLGGRPAYTMIGADGKPMAVAWQYATGGWAIADWGGGARPAGIMMVADNVRYGARLRIHFPVKLIGMPASWKLSGVGYLAERGRFVAQDLYVGPAQDPAGIDLHVEPAFSPACGLVGRQQPVSFEGARGVLVRTPSQKNAILDIRTGRMMPSKAQQDVCFPSLHGMFVSMDVHDDLGNAMSLLRHLRILGPDPANWTTNPLG